MTTSREDNPRGAGSGAVVGPVLRGEVLSETASAEVTRRCAESGALASCLPAEVLRRSAELARRALAMAWQSDHLARARLVAMYRVRQAPRDLGRLSWFAIRGHARWIGKAWIFVTYADLRADARGARMAGDPEARRAAQELIRADARARWAKLGVFVHRATSAALIGSALVLMLWVIDSSMTRDQMWSWLAALYGTIDGVRFALQNRDADPGRAGPRGLDRGRRVRGAGQDSGRVLAGAPGPG